MHRLLRLFGDFLAAQDDPEAGAALYALHTADAPVRHESGIAPRAQVDGIEFARLHRDICLRGQGALPKLGQPVLVRALTSGEAAGVDAIEVEGAETVAWFDVTDLREQRQVTAILGARTIDGSLRIGWCTCAPRAGIGNYEDGLLQSLADYPWMRHPEPAQARTLLDAAYFRRYWRSPLKFATLPDARFSCQMSTACCKHDYEITLPPEAQLLIDAMPWETLQPQLLHTRLPVRPDGKLQLKALDETCRFLNSQGQCVIHKKIGRQPFGPCAVFPFAFARTPEGIAVGMSPICGSVRRGLGIAPRDREDDLRERVIQAEPRQPNGFRLAAGTPIAWERFRDIEQALCEILVAQGLPMRRRLYVGSRLLGALRDGEPLDMNQWVAEPPLVVDAALREAIRGMLVKILSWDRTTLRKLSGALPEALFELEAGEPESAAVLFRNVLFCKVYSYPFDLTTAYNFVIVLYLLMLVMQMSSGAPLSDVMWRELGSLGVHGLLSSVLHEGVPEGFRALFGTAQFGLWMLCA
jgi:Fe-S-cluster containining protein